MQPGDSTDFSTQLNEKRPPITVDRNGGSFPLWADRQELTLWLVGMLWRKMEPSENRRSDDPLGIAPPTPWFVNSKTEREGTDSIALPGRHIPDYPSMTSDKTTSTLYDGLFSMPGTPKLDTVPLYVPSFYSEDTTMGDASGYWLSSHFSQPQFYPPSRGLGAYPTPDRPEKYPVSVSTPFPRSRRTEKQRLWPS